MRAAFLGIALQVAASTSQSDSLYAVIEAIVGDSRDITAVLRAVPKLFRPALRHMLVRRLTLLWSWALRRSWTITVADSTDALTEEELRAWLANYVAAVLDEVRAAERGTTNGQPDREAICPRAKWERIR